MIAPLWLDYQRADPRRRRAGVLLLGLGVLAGSLLFGHYTDLVAEQENVRQEVSRLQRVAARAAPPPGDAAARGGARAVAYSGSAPPSVPRSAAAWESLFAALEAAGDETVTLLGLQPGGSQIAIAGEARDLPAAMDYLTRLQSAPVFAEVRLTHSEIVVAHPQRPLRFALLATWQGETPAARTPAENAAPPAGKPEATP